MIKERAYAKLNLSLDVLNKREDGYHNMKMVMQSAMLCDELTLELTDGELRIETNIPYIPRDDRNVAFKAASAFFAATGLKSTGAVIKIKKRVPVRAGLGGGSSDAAAVLRALNKLCGTRLSGDELRQIGFSVGSDVPFCVEGGTMLAQGRGELLSPLPPLPETDAVICMPGFSASTPELFSRIDSRSSRCRPDTEGLVAALGAGDVTGVSRRMYNVFESVLGKRSGAINELKGVLLDKGALGAAMSGTGSAVFGLFADAESARRAAAAAEPLCREVFLTKTTGSAEI
ncbi:MAG: 4-(cytidine 5'-diphospho)-2-C-methyl-D-erythritol kinase [Oscillospiraceae bacterium]